METKMTINPALLRTLLLRFDAGDLSVPDTLPGASHQDILDHVELMDGSGLINALIQRSNRTAARPVYAAAVKRVTAFGHDFAGLASSDADWNATMAAFAETGVRVSVDLIMGQLTRRAEQRLNSVQ